MHLFAGIHPYTCIYVHVCAFTNVYMCCAGVRSMRKHMNIIYTYMYSGMFPCTQKSLGVCPCIVHMGLYPHCWPPAPDPTWAPVPAEQGNCRNHELVACDPGGTKRRKSRSKKCVVFHTYIYIYSMCMYTIYCVSYNVIYYMSYIPYHV